MITGSGILIVELYKSVPVIVLFGYNKTNFSDAGGLLNMGETPEMGACRECREESGNLLNIKPHELQQIGTPIQFHQYMAYIIYVQNLKATDYVHNVNHIFRNCYDKSWKETNTITRIHLHDIIRASQTNQNYVNDIYGGICPIRGRTMGIIKYSANILTNITQYQPMMLQRNYITQSRMPCLIGTYSYTLLTSSSPQFHQPNIMTTSSNISKYAIYIIPKDTSFLNCRKNTITHITISGFTDKFNHSQLNNVLLSLTNKMNGDKWKINVDTVTIHDKILYFKSKTLDKIAKFMYKSGIKKIKGPKFDANDWHISLDCKIIPVNTIKKLKSIKWYICVVSKNMGQIKVYDKYTVKKIDI